MRNLLLIGAILCAASSPVLAAPPWQTPAQGPQLSHTDVGNLIAKTCWGWFDRGNHNQNAMGAVYIRFSATPPLVGHMWSKSGQAARDNPSSDLPAGYDDRGQTAPMTVTSIGTELTFFTGVSQDWQRFDWYLAPNGNATYKIRAVGVGNRGAVGSLHCR